MNNVHVLLITSGQPSLNPRLVKEADALSDNGFKVKVLYQYWNEWGTALDVTLLKDKKWTYEQVGGNPVTKKGLYFYTRLHYKIARILIKYIGFKGNLPELSIGRSTIHLIKAAKRTKADLYIAHNLAALPAAVIASSKHNAKCGFDAEDFHRNEVSDDINSLEFSLSRYIEDKYLPKLNYITTASPLISEAYKNLYPQLNPKTILNVFPKQNINVSNRSDEVLKLFWFSQSIGFDRGLEDVIKAMGALNDSKIELHLLGSYISGTKLTFEEFAENMGLEKNKLFFYQPINASEIFDFATKFDIGLATEIGSPKNRDICLTNKIFTYIHSGLAIVASDTSAQKQIMQKFKEIGRVYERENIASLQNILLTYLQHKDLLATHQLQSKTYANEELNWENEQVKFLEIINGIIHR